MIFVTVGTQIPFDRLIKIIDELAPELGGEEIIAQTSECARYAPRNFRTVGFLPPDRFNDIFNRARLVVAHAGMGTIISALRQAKPLIIFPRKASLGEHRNEHQLATAAEMEKLGAVAVAYDADDLRRLLTGGADLTPGAISPTPSATLIDAIREYIG